MNKSRLVINLALLALIGLMSRIGAEEWTVPADAAAVANPVASAPEAIGQGAAVYRQSCLICHGDGGKGDGTGGTFLVPKPTNLTDETLRKESDGALFWKITTGRITMPANKNLTDQQRWQVVLYIRTLSQAVSRSP
jgi:mono/diheme cytochrome c family protein